MLFTKKPDDFGQEIGSDRRKRTQEDLPANLAAHVADLLSPMLGCRKDTQHMWQKERTSRSENRSAPGPLKEWFANVGLQFLDLLTE
jgi:hypothetical protein